QQPRLPKPSPVRTNHRLNQDNTPVRQNGTTPGFGGSYELRLGVDEAEELGGVDLIRSALRKAGRSLGWSRLETFGGSFPQVAVAGVVDRREIPEEFAAAVEEYQSARGRASAEVIGQTWQDGRPRAVPGSVFLVAQEFRAAYAEGAAG
ncbi:hypothetical protein, partial [Streptomyces sp. NPDC048349]|uniref:hypothetical protein n=1 Tax=Streptomyces sp. NPDC048349 TaxID=3155486 RepID=UPI0034436105